MFTRLQQLEPTFKEMHGIKPEIHRDRISSNEYSIKLIHNGKEAIITEVMERGLTKKVTMNGQDFKTFYEAENEAVKLLEGK
jgi:hypothetical protein